CSSDLPLLQTDLLGVFAIRRAHPDTGLLESRQATEVLDHPMQIDCSRAMAELLAAERAIAALLMRETGPGRRLLRFGGVVFATQFDPIAELMIIVEGNAVLDGHCPFVPSSAFQLCPALEQLVHFLLQAVESRQYLRGDLLRPLTDGRVGYLLLHRRHFLLQGVDLPGNRFQLALQLVT